MSLFKRDMLREYLREKIQKYNEICNESDKISTVEYIVIDKILMINGQSKIEQNPRNTKIWIELYDYMYGLKLEKYHISTIKYEVKTRDMFIYGG